MRQAQKKPRSPGTPIAKAKRTPTCQHGPPSPVSEGGAVQKPSAPARFKCFFAVLDPAHTETLRGTKFSACLKGFPTVSRLKEHLWRSHSLTHNCSYCRERTTKASREFTELHAHCALRTSIKSRGAVPRLISQKQDDALKALNQHFDKPRDEEIRCGKLWEALFPGTEFDLERFEIRNNNTAGANGVQAGQDRHPANASSAADVGRRPPPQASQRPQNTTPPPSPVAPQRSRTGSEVRTLFSVVPEPKEKDHYNGPHTLSHDSGIGTEPAEPAFLEDDRAFVDPKVISNRQYRGQSPVLRDMGRSSRSESIDYLTGLSPVSQSSNPIYPQRVLEGPDGDMSEDAESITDDGAVEHGHDFGTFPPLEYSDDGRSEVSRGSGSRMDVDTEESEDDDNHDDHDEDDEYDNDDDDMSVTGSKQPYYDVDMADHAVNALIKHSLVNACRSSDAESWGGFDARSSFSGSELEY